MEAGPPHRPGLAAMDLLATIAGNDFAAYAGLFALAFVAATLLPAQSEAALVALLLAGNQPATALVAAASAGNILGSVVNWALGRAVMRFRDRAWFPASPAAIDRATRWYARWGRWSLLASWLPIVGDPLTVVAGILREPLWRFLLVVGFAKTARYAVLAALV